jgi:hypothetical protein
MSLDYAREILAENGSMNDPHGYALALATIELAEQQRIANLLAFAAFQHEGSDGRVLATTTEGAIALRLMVGTALDLPDDLGREPSDAGDS